MPRRILSLARLVSESCFRRPRVTRGAFEAFLLIQWRVNCGRKLVHSLRFLGAIRHLISDGNTVFVRAVIVPNNRLHVKELLNSDAIVKFTDFGYVVFDRRGKTEFDLWNQYTDCERCDGLRVRERLSRQVVVCTFTPSLSHCFRCFKRKSKLQVVSY
jgi:hypothetical protein